MNKGLNKRWVILTVLLAALLLAVPAASAQADEPPAVDADIALLPDWLTGLAVAGIPVGALILSLTEVGKSLLKLTGLYRDGQGRYIVFGLAAALVVILLATESFGLHEAVEPAIARLYAISEALLGLLAAVGAYDFAKVRGLFPGSDEQATPATVGTIVVDTESFRQAVHDTVSVAED